MMTSRLRRPHQPLITRVLPALLLAGLAACGGGGGDSSPNAPVVPVVPEVPTGPGSSGITDTTPYSTDANASLATASEAQAVTQHSLSLAGGSVSYTATAGHLTANDLNSGTAQASFFYVAYTATGASAATPAARPVTFFFNGGPGSASMWLHMGSYGPKRLATNMPSNQIASSFAVVDNAESLIDVSDLVFVDAVGTGHSEAIAPNSNRSFWGVDADVRVFRDFIARYLAVNGRSASPRVVFGESYGTLRAAILAEELESSGVGIDGVVLLSSVLDYNSNCGVVDDSRSACGGYLPSYAATSAWFNRTQPAPADVNAFVLQAMSFADERYGPAVSAYIAGTAQPSAALIGELSAMTGLTTTLWQSQFNLGPDTYRSKLLPGQLLGRYDARISGAVGGPVAADGDPSLTVIEAPYLAAARSYLQSELAYRSSAPYNSFSDAIQVWSFEHDGKRLPDAIPDLATAMTLNPKLRVLSLNGHHDLATPFHQTVQDLRRLGPQSRITVQHVAGGHMTYLDDSSRRLQRAALGDFYRSLRTSP